MIYNEDMNTYTKLIGKYKNNEKCYVIGAGPSLRFLVNDLKFKEAQKNNIMIFVNSSILALRIKKENIHNKYFLSCDSAIMNWDYYKQVLIAKSMGATVVVRSSWEKYKEKIKDFFIFEPRCTSEETIDYQEQRLAYCSSVIASLDLVLQMGCKKIYLLGVDHYTDGWRSHFWQYWTYSKWPKGPLAPITQQKESFNHNIQAFEALKGFADYLGAEIYNCNKDSRVEVYEKIDFKDSL